jgi:type II secretory ATPase GspE/PulE/Tfp pilus assembly ATPase PilB-like protein
MRRLFVFFAAVAIGMLGTRPLWAQAGVGQLAPALMEPGRAGMPGAGGPGGPGGMPGGMRGPAAASSAAAPAAGPAAAPAAESGQPGWSGPGLYLNWMKVLAFWLVFLLWVFTTDWINRDTQETKILEYLRWNPIVFGSFMVAFVVAWYIPLFWVGLALLAVAYVTPFASYVIIRNGKVTSNLRVLTPAHLRFWFAQQARRVGVKIQAEVVDPHESGPPVVLTARGGANERENNVRLLSARQAPGFREARQVLADGLSRRADAIILDFVQQAVEVRYLVDGVWLEGQAYDRETCDPALEALKILCGLNPQERQRRQEGAFQAEFRGGGKPESVSCTFASQGTATGERVALQWERKRVSFASLEELGMRPKMQEQLIEVIAKPAGFVLLSAMPGAGLRSTTNVLLRGLDRFMREFATLEDETNRYEPIENVPVTTYKPDQQKDLTDVLRKLFHTEPSVVVIRDLVNPTMVAQMFDEIRENRMFISTIRAKDAVDALVRLIGLKVPADGVAQNVSAVLSQRLIRKLCESCKEAFVPTPELLQQLQLPPGRVQALYRPRTPHPEQPEEPCRKCHGVGYLGRTAIFELLLVDPSLGKTLSGLPKPDVVRQAARRAGFRTLQEEGILLVAKGVTSLAELMRVLKQ